MASFDVQERSALSGVRVGLKVAVDGGCDGPTLRALPAIFPSYETFRI